MGQGAGSVGSFAGGVGTERCESDAREIVRLVRVSGDRPYMKRMAMVVPSDTICCCGTCWTTRPLLVPAWRELGSFKALEDNHDTIFVCGHSWVYDPFKEYGFPPSLQSKVKFCGYASPDEPNGSCKGAPGRREEGS